MKRISIFTFLTSIFIILVLAACERKVEVSPDKNTEPQKNLRTSRDILLYYYQMLGEFEKCDAYAYMMNFNTLPSQNSTDYEVSIFSQFFRDRAKMLGDSNYDAFSVNNVSIPKDGVGSFFTRNVTFNNLYGKNINLKFSKGQDQTEIKNLYLPKKLNVSITPDMGGNNYQIKEGTVFEWNADELNEKGVVIKIEYNPVFNTSQISQNYPEPIVKFIGVPDNGSYTLTGQDISGLPSKADVNISVMRGLVQLNMFENNNKSFITIAYHEISAIGYVK
jgi:hypothetical protein